MIRNISVPLFPDKGINGGTIIHEDEKAMTEPVKIKMKDGKAQFEYNLPIDSKKVAPDDELECAIKGEMGGSYGAKNRGEALANLANAAVYAASTKGLSHKLKSDIHAHASMLHAKAAAAYDDDNDGDNDMSKHHNEMSERHGKISAELMK